MISTTPRVLITFSFGLFDHVGDAFADFLLDLAQTFSRTIQLVSFRSMGGADCVVFSRRTRARGVLSARSLGSTAIPASSELRPRCSSDRLEWGFRRAALPVDRIVFWRRIRRDSSAKWTQMLQIGAAAPSICRRGPGARLENPPCAINSVRRGPLDPHWPTLTRWVHTTSKLR